MEKFQGGPEQVLFEGEVDVVDVGHAAGAEVQSVDVELFEKHAGVKNKRIITDKNKDHLPEKRPRLVETGPKLSDLFKVNFLIYAKIRLHGFTTFQQHY